MHGLSSEAQARQAQLLRKYMASLPEKRARIGDGWKQLQSSGWSADMLAKLIIEVHRLAGSAGSYGFEELGAVALTLVGSLKSGAGSPELRRVIGQQITSLLEALETAASETI